MPNNNNTIPQGWQTKSLGQIGTFLKGKGITKAEIIETGKPCIRYGQIYSEYNYFVKEFKSFIDETSAKKSEPIFKNDLLFAGSGETLTDIGKCVAYIKDEEAYAGGDIVILRPNSEDSHYLGYLFNADEFKKQTYKLGQGHSVVHLYSSSLKNVKVTLPPLPEQQKIAQILATWDKAIKLQQQLIDNKKQYKKAVMKKLLTGEVRFKGFRERWRLKSLDEIAIFKNGKGHETVVDENGEYIIVNSKFISTEGNVIKYTNQNLSPLNKNEITLVMSDIPNGKALAKCFFIDEDNKYSLNQRICSLKPKTGTDTRFLFYLLNRNQHFLEFNNGVSQTNLRKDEVLECPLMIPTIEEQQKIALLLSKVDCEIKVLENELISFQKQKKGLMQQLLTGKERVKN
ncbi:restriction endonuclease subunit S [Flavobacterium sp. FPG59]|uniref:restriction endonuclease subunit S n=1 Tax=Flavobacterium sp. FPG59 TaxID=1929267 RepID=UPI000A3D44A2|nr:restriction endonuclease subunit S [Flavobacterium sp. FPG59]OUD36300.1 hypothetical protein FPG59_06730 [Flavobacterium sp. FPG59]